MSFVFPFIPKEVIYAFEIMQLNSENKSSKVFFKIKTFLDNDFLGGVNINCHSPKQELFIQWYILTKR